MQRIFKEFWASTSFPFQAFGLSSQAPQHENKKFILIYNVTISIVVCIIILITFLGKPNLFIDESVEEIVDYALLYSFLFAHLIILIESNITTGDQQILFITLSRLTETFHKNFEYKIRFHSLQMKCFKKIWLVTLSTFFTIYISSSTFDDFWTFFGRSVFSMVAVRLRFIQISIFVDTLTEYFHHLSVVLTRMLEQASNAGDISQKLLIVQDVYGNLIESNQLIEKIFRWSITAIIVQNFADMMNQCYWTFINIYYLGSVTFGISKF